MTKSRNYTWISLLVLMALAFALLFAFVVAPAQANAEPETHTHDDVTFTAWTSTTSLPGSAGSYYLTADVTLSGTWTMPSGGVSICLNGHGIKAANDARVITVNGGTLNLYDCGDATHYFDVDGGKAVNVNDVSGTNSFTGGYITGGVGKSGLAQGSVYWNEGAGILVWSGTFNMYGGTILGNSASHGGGVEVVNASMNMYGGTIMYNTCGEGGSGINLRSQDGNTVTLNMYGGSVSYNKGTAIDQSYCYGNRYLNLYGGTVSHNTGTGVWVGNAIVSGDPVIEENTGRGILANNLSIAGSPAIRNNTSGNVYVSNNGKITIAGALSVAEPIGVTMQNNATGVFTSGLSGDPADYFFSDNADYHVEEMEGEAAIVAGPIINVNNLQGIIKSYNVNKTDTIGSLKATAAAQFGVDASEYKLVNGDVDLSDSDTFEDCGIIGKSTLYLLPISGQGLKTLTLVPTLSIEGISEVARGVYSSVQKDDTIQIIYASRQNSGFGEMVFATAFNEEYFHLTSVSVDANYTLLNDYGREVGDTYVPMTLAQHIADHNAALDAGEDPYTALLVFNMYYNGGLLDPEGILSDAFITVTYTVVKDVPAGSEMKFGFDMSLDGMFTNAAYDDEILLNIIDAEGKTVDEEMVSFIVKGMTSVVIPEDQILTFKPSGSSYAVDAGDIEITWIAPEFTAPAVNPYIEDGGSVTYTFYTKNGDEYEPISGVPTAVGDYYVKATLTETDAYLGYETDYVAISVARRQVAVPDLKLYAGEDSETPTYAEGKLSIAAEDVTYGTTLTLKEIINAAESVYGFANQNLSYVFSKDNGESWGNVSNFFNSQPIPVGSYKLTIAPKDSAYVEFDASPAVDAIVIEITVVKAKVVAPTETAETYTYTGEEQTYEFATAGSSALYTVSNDKRTIAGSQTVTVAINDKDNYEWVNGGVADLSFTFTIGKAKVVAPTETTETYTYTGEEQTYEFATAGSSALYTVSNDKRTVAGSQTVTVAINDKDNYEWENGGDADLSFTFTIGKAKVTAPTETTETYTYSGEEQTYDFAADGDTDLFTVSNDTRTNAGEQTVTVSLKDSDNYEWTTGGIDAKTFTFTIAAKTLTVKTYIDEETEYELTYGDAVPAANLFTFEAEGIVEGDENDVNGALEVQPVNAYTQYAGVGDYVYTTGVKSGSTLNANYSLGTPGTAKIVVTAKALTLTAAYNGGTVTLTCGGIVNNDAITLTYSVDGVALSSNVYTAVAADVPKEEIVAAVTTTNANYSAAELDLNAVYSVTFEFTEAFSTAAGLPAVQYVFDGQKAAEPAEPTFDNNHVFLYWALEDEEYDFATAVEDDLVLVAAWEKMVYEFRFRALNDGADYATGLYRELKWENGAFVLADTAATFPFTKNTEIPTVGSIGAFRVTSWVKAVKVDNEYTYTTVTAFDVLVSTETDADAYYIAIMTLDLGLGDINGDGSVTAEDIILMKKCLVGVKFTTITDAAAAWAKIGEPVPANGYLYTFLWDVNSDGFKDTRDVFIARAALATGHGYEICSDVTVNGVYHTNDVIVGPNDVAFDGQVVFVDDAEALGAALAAGKRVGMIADIALEDGAFITDKDIYIDLGGHTLSIGEFTVETIGTVTVKNGKLDIETSFTIDGSSIDFANVKDGEDIDLVISGVTHAFITAE